MNRDASMSHADSACSVQDLDTAASWTQNSAIEQTYTPFYAPLSGRATYADTTVISQQHLQQLPAGVDISGELQHIVHGSMALANSLSISAAGPSVCRTHGSSGAQVPLAAAGPCLSISNSSSLVSANATRSGPVTFSYIPLTLVQVNTINSSTAPLLAPLRLGQTAGADAVAPVTATPTTPTGQRLSRPVVPPAVKPTRRLFRCPVNAATGANCSQMAELHMRQQQLQRVQDWLAGAHC